MTEPTKSLKPPYATFATFLNFFNKLRESGVPSRIDRSVFGNASGSVVYSVLASLKFLNLIDEEGTPSEFMIQISSAEDTDRKPLLRSMLQQGYPSLFNGGLDLSKVSAGQFDDYLREQFGAQGSTVDKAAAFFIHAAKEADIELSHGLLTRKPAFSSKSSRKSAKQRKVASAPEVPPITAAPSAEKISEKALEYRLVDLLKDASGEPEVMQQIMGVIVWLQTRQAIPAHEEDT